MSGARLLGAAGLLLAALSVALGGGDPVSRGLLALGAPAAAVRLAQSPELRAEAFFATKQWVAAADVYAVLGARFNEGVAAAHAGDYARALAAFDAVLLVDPADGEARANHALVRGLFAGTGFDRQTPSEDRERDEVEMEAEAGQGSARAASTGSEAHNPATAFAMPEVRGQGLRRVPNIFDAHYLEASERWLDTMPDEPGLYLKARLKVEQKAREAAGTAVAPAEDPR